jgi:hypothetical protein
VAECRRCGLVVCRNCTAKAPSDRYLPDRHRRLCNTCLEAPLSEHLQPLKPSLDAYDALLQSGASSTRSARSESGVSTDTLSEYLDHPIEHTAFTAEAFLRHPCCCASQGIYLCHTCGQNLRSNDTTYRRVWTWRSRYSTHIGGGIGTGLGVGNQGQKCGREDQCLDSGPNSISWVEIDCSENHGEDGQEGGISRTGTPASDKSTSGNHSSRPGYLQQEVEGIGGVVKKKVRRKVKVGATVVEHEDERMDPRQYLVREAKGLVRSWCGWCDRVCLGETDRSAGLGA